MSVSRAKLTVSAATRAWLLFLVLVGALPAAPFHRDSLAVPEAAKFTVTRDDYPGLHNPNPRGWYYQCANVVLAKDGALVASWQLSDQHTSLTSWLMSARSTDGGRTWTEHRAFTHASVWEHGVAISAGCWVRFDAQRISLGGRPAAGFAFDTRGWHTYRIVRGNGQIAIFADGIEKLREKIDDLWVREVRFGNRSVPRAGETYPQNKAVSHWRAVAVKVTNDARDTSIDWRWTPAQGYPDQFRRDRIVVLDNEGDCGYSSWIQLPDGKIVMVDYTVARVAGGGEGKVSPKHIIRAYHVTEKELVRGP